jgi:hypothetical protein
LWLQKTCIQCIHLFLQLPKKETKLDQRRVKELRAKGCPDDAAPVLAEIEYDEAAEENRAREAIKDEFHSTSDAINDSFTVVRYELRAIDDSIKNLDAKINAKVAAVPTFLQTVQLLVIVLGVATAILKLLP